MKQTLTLLLILTTLAAHSQFGVKLGASLSQFYGSTEPDFEPKSNLVAGVYHRIYLGKSLSLQPELIYENKGSLINLDPGQEKFRQNLNYLALPVTLNVHPTKWLALSAGGYAAYLTRMHISKWNYEYNIKEQNLNNFRRMDYGLVYGVSFDPIGVIFQFQGTYGMRVVGKPGMPYGRWGNNTDANKNASYSFSMLVPFKLHTK